MPGPRRLVRAMATDVGPLRRSRSFRMLFCGQLVSMIGRQVTIVALPYQVYVRTGSPLAVGLLGLAQLLPLLVTSLLGGAIADRADRRRLLLLTNTLLAACSACLAVAALVGDPPLALLYVLAALIAGFGAVDQPARSATVPGLVTRADLPAALALMFGLFQVTLIAGPAIGGLILSRSGLAAAYLVDVVTFGAALLAVALLPPQPPSADHHEGTFASIATGMRHLRTQPIIVSTFVADIDAMVFGMPRALFPVLAATVYHVGPDGLGLLYAAPAVGSVAAVLSAGPATRSVHKGRVVVLAVATWGAAIAVMGLVPALPLALAALAVAGAADGWSAVCRNSIAQLRTPDALRGRVSATYTMVVAGGPYLGDAESGVVAALTSPVVSVVSGGVLCLIGIAALVAAVPELWNARDEAEER